MTCSLANLVDWNRENAGQWSSQTPPRDRRGASSGNFGINRALAEALMRNNIYVYINVARSNNNNNNDS